MTHSYGQSSFINGDRQFEATENSETRQIRGISPLRSFLPFSCGVMDANETMQWDIRTDLLFDAFWVYYPGAPSGTITLTVLDAEGNPSAVLAISTNNNGEKFDNAWKYDFNGSFSLGKGSKVQLKPSVAINAVAAYGEPCLMFDRQNGVSLS